MEKLFGIFCDENKNITREDNKKLISDNYSGVHFDISNNLYLLSHPFIFFGQWLVVFPYPHICMNSNNFNDWTITCVKPS